MTYTETLRLDAPPYPAHLVQASRILLLDTAPLLRSQPQNVALAQIMLSRYPEHRAQIEPAARALGADPIDMMLATLSYDLLMGWYGCSTMALATDEASSGTQHGLVANGQDRQSQLRPAPR
jgi:hypothetical protein